MKLKLYTLFLGLVVILVGCGRQSDMPYLELSIPSDAVGDSLVRLLYLGKGWRSKDSLRLDASRLLRLSPDTNQIDEVYVYYDSGREVVRFLRQGTQWGQEAITPNRLAPIVKETPYFACEDCRGERLSLRDLYTEGDVALVFGDLANRTITKTFADSLKNHHRGRKLQFVYLMLSPHRRESLDRIKRDSLQGRVVCDSLTDVSTLRQQIGIARCPTPQVFLVDSLGQMSEINLATKR